MAVVSRATRLIAGVAVALLTSGCSGDDSGVRDNGPRPRTVPPDSVVKCQSRSEPQPAEGLRAGDDVRVATADLEGGGRFELFTFLGPPARTTLGRRRGWLWKTPVGLSAERSITLAVAGRSARRGRLVFARQPRSFGGADRTTRFTACAADTPLFSGPGTVGPETGWGGSLVTLDRRVCLRLRVYTGQRSVPLRVALGRHC